MIKKQKKNNNLMSHTKLSLFFFIKFINFHVIILTINYALRFIVDPLAKVIFIE